jgi:NADH dehydrogenase/NADH:ubiquinone oxidoreductase subunit G
MSETVKIKMDGIEFKAPAGMNIIDAAEIAGIHIPNLCYLKGTKGVGACRLCLVDVEGVKDHSIACNTKVKEGMVINTNTDEILESRKFVIDLILSMHPLDCMTCTKAGICNLQKYAYDFDLKESSFKRKKFGHPVDVGNPFIKMSPDYCVLCGKCVRVCKEQGTNVLEFMGRGVGAKVSTVVDRSLHESDCTFCGSCIDACPVNAIVEYDRVRKGREWDYEKISSVCLLCGNACDIQVHLKDNAIQKISAGEEKGSATKYICAYGRFGYDYLAADNRLTTPMKRVDGELIETTWADALEIVAAQLKKAGKDAGVISVAGIVNEDALTMKSFAKDAIGTKNFDTTLGLYSDIESLSNSDTALVGESDMVITVGINPSQRERVIPALNVLIRKKAARGAPLVTINIAETKLDKVASHVLKGEETDTLKAFIKAAIDKGVKADKELKDAVKDANITEEIAAAAELFVKAEKPLILTSPALFGAAANISTMKGKTLTISFEANSRGVALMGLITEGKSMKEMISGGTKLLYSVGEVPVKQRPETDFLIVQNSHISELAKQADVLLPSATYLETSGTIIDFKGRLRDMPRMIDPLGRAKLHRDIFKDVAKAMGKKLKAVKEADVKKAFKVKPVSKVRPFEKNDALNIPPENILESVSSSLLNSSRLLWLKELEKACALAKA